jgi:cohesin complex subunit SA-1/2
MLLDERTSGGLADEDATNLVRVLSASVKKSVGEKIVPASDNRKVSLTKVQKASASWKLSWKLIHNFYSQ